MGLWEWMKSLRMKKRSGFGAKEIKETREVWVRTKIGYEKVDGLWTVGSG